MSDLSRRLLIAAKECSIPTFAALFGDAAKEIEIQSKVAEELEERASRTWPEREPPHCPSCSCGVTSNDGEVGK